MSLTLIQVQWMYWPHEVPGGKTSYRGTNELINSNHQQELDGRTFDGKAKVRWWDENDEKPKALFYRQNWDVTKKELSVGF
jgi:hypothetical protein